MISCFAQAESESISKNVSWGVRQSFKNGKVPIKYSTLLGYREGKNKLPEIIPDEAEIVKEIYRSYLDGMSLKQIADSLNSRGLTTKRKNSAWKPETVKGILVNEKYSGDAILQKTYVTDCITKTTRKNNGELPMYLVKNHHDPIISRTDFNRVQEEMARRSAKRTIAEKLTKTEQGKYSAKYALSELRNSEVYCGALRKKQNAEIHQRRTVMPDWICANQEPYVQKEKDMQVYGRRQRRNSPKSEIR